MSEKDFKALAEAIRCILNPDARLQAAVAVASACMSRNKKFDVDTFFSACGVSK